MTNPTLERAARALAACEQSDYEFGDMADHYTKMVRAVLMAVLPDADKSGEAAYRFIQAILNDGEGE